MSRIISKSEEKAHEEFYHREALEAMGIDFDQNESKWEEETSSRLAKEPPFNMEEFFK